MTTNLTNCSYKFLEYSNNNAIRNINTSHNIDHIKKGKHKILSSDDTKKIKTEMKLYQMLYSSNNENSKGKEYYKDKYKAAERELIASEYTILYNKYIKSIGETSIQSQHDEENRLAIINKHQQETQTLKLEKETISKALDETKNLIVLLSTEYETKMRADLASSDNAIDNYCEEINKLRNIIKEKNKETEQLKLEVRDYKRKYEDIRNMQIPLKKRKL